MKCRENVLNIISLSFRFDDKRRAICVCFEFVYFQDSPYSLEIKIDIYRSTNRRVIIIMIVRVQI